MSSLLLYGKYVIPDSRTTMEGGAVYIQDGVIQALGPYRELVEQYRPDRTVGSADSLIIPGLINAHGHGRGITDFQRGAVDDTLEVWKFRKYPPVSLYWDTLWQAILLIESGVTAVMHNHTPTSPLQAGEEMGNILKAYQASDLRVAFAPALSYVNTFVYGDQEPFLASLSMEDRKKAEAIMQNSKQFSPERYFDTVDSLSKDFSTDKMQIHHGPMAPQWVEEEVLYEIDRRARRENKMLFTHVQQTPHQFLYGLKKYGKTLIAWMAEKGILGPHVTLGHCVWITKEDVHTLRQTGVNVTHHPSCNLRVRNGISPVWPLWKAGVTVGIGMDDKEFGDERDFIEEARMAAKLHRVVDHVPGSGCLGSREVFHMVTEGGARCIGLQIGKLEVGKPADVVLLDYTRMTEPFTYPYHDPVEVLLQRGRKSHITHVLIGGKIVLENGKLTQIDKTEVLTKLKESIPLDYADQFEKAQESLRSLKQALTRYFASQAKEIEQVCKKPFYYMNNEGEKNDEA